jgi:hypothetical protein
MTAPDYAPEAMPSMQLSPIVAEINRKIAANALNNLNDGQLQLVLEAYMTARYSPRKAAVVLMMIARQCEIAPWEGDRRK